MHCARIERLIYNLHDGHYHIVEAASQKETALTFGTFISTFSYSIPNILCIIEKLISYSTFWWEKVVFWLKNAIFRVGLAKF